MAMAVDLRVMTDFLDFPIDFWVTDMISREFCVRFGNENMGCGIEVSWEYHMYK